MHRPRTLGGWVTLVIVLLVTVIAVYLMIVGIYILNSENTPD